MDDYRDELDERINARSSAIYDFITAEPEEEDGDEEEEEGDEEEEDEEAEEDPEMPERDDVSYPPRADPTPNVFNRDQKLVDKYTQFEIESFMNLLNIRPFKSWKDQTGYHNQMGAKAYEDES